MKKQISNTWVKKNLGMVEILLSSGIKGKKNKLKSKKKSKDGP